jgi:N-acetyl-anhydromuramyl-L-alanine amidase AmpD
MVLFLIGSEFRLRRVDGVDPFPQAQLDALVKLMRDIAQRHGVKREGIKRHSDLDRGVMPCAPKQRRKVDPGDAFPFEKMLDRVLSER